MTTAYSGGQTNIASESSRGLTSGADMRTLLLGAGNPAQNWLINGAADFSQRSGTSLITFSNGNQGYFADRWYGYAGASTTTDFQQSASALLEEFGLSNLLRAWRPAGNTGTSTFLIGQIIESANVRGLVGKTVTLSFYARKGADFSATGSLMSARLFTGTGTDQGLASRIASTWTGFDTTRTQDVTLTTAWQRFSVTFTIPTTVKEIVVEFRAAGTGTAGANDFFEVSGAMLNVGSTAQPFSRAGGTIGGEELLCRRYGFDATPFLLTVDTHHVVALADNSTYVETNPYQFPVRMFKTPTPIISGLVGFKGCNVVGTVVGTAASVSAQRLNPSAYSIRVTGTSITTAATHLYLGTSGKIFFDAEL